ncbi:MAG: hypothetical protein KGH49_00645 [Candidatus Micrarchaeota archaeon]|nr:hypothetical protein [Candidatus Micrarchaeota archaeon]
MPEEEKKKYKFLFVTDEALSADLAWKVKEEGHSVKFFCKNQTEKDVGDGFIEKVDGWEPHKDWADIILFDDIGHGSAADQLRKEGKFVVGGSAYTDKLELDRGFGQDELKAAGVAILPGYMFTSFDNAIEFVKANPDRYVIKPSGAAQDEKELLFVGQEENGNDVLQVLVHYKEAWSKKIKVFMLQKVAEGVEVAAGAFFNGKEFITPINTNFEHKKLFPNDIGPSTGEMGCYDDKTEVLTDSGWKFFKDLVPEDLICTLNPSNENIEFNRPEQIVSFNHHKKLISIQNRALDIMVTPDHNMYVESQQDYKMGRNNFKSVKARELEFQSRIKRTGIWKGEKREFFELPSVMVGHYSGSEVMLTQSGALKLSMDLWLPFLGIWLSDGSTSHHHSYRIDIAQKKEVATAKIEALLSKLPFKFKRASTSFYCDNKQLHSYLSQFGRAYEKQVPEFIKSLDPEQIQLFLEWFALGDGTLMKNNFRIFYTSSKKLADDIQELLFKIGRVGVVKQRQRSGRVWIKDHYADASRMQYEVLERVKKLHSWIDKRDIKTVDYSGVVYCATVKNHIMYVRRNGKPYWCGNTTMYWAKTNAIFENTLLKMKDKIAASGYVGYIDINCIANSRGIWPLEFTSRFGYPTISIQMEGMTNEVGQFLYDLAHGNNAFLKTKKGYQVGVVVAIPPFPFEDAKAFKRYSEGATILFRKQKPDGVHIGEVKRNGDDWYIAGQSGYALVITGAGATMADAIKEAYQNVKSVIIPGMFYRIDIGQKWGRDSDMLLSWGYL